MKELQPIKRVKKVWGLETWLVNQEDISYCSKILSVAVGRYSSYHYHPIKEETFYILSGKLQFTLERKVFEMLPGDRIHIPPKTKHKFEGLEYSRILEISTFHSDDDVVRLSESGKRETKV